MSALQQATLSLCLQYLHRHPMELAGLPSEVLVDLAAQRLLEREAEEAS